jgi:Ni/Co efflux regulator RcnB
MKKLLFIIAVAGIFAACSSANSQDCSKDDKAKTEMTEKKSDCETKEAKSDCATKEKKSDCCDSKKETKSGCEGEKKAETKAEAKSDCATKSGCGAKGKSSDCSGKVHTPC